jgi:biopolymer transport protein TolQ
MTEDAPHGKRERITKDAASWSAIGRRATFRAGNMPIHPSIFGLIAQATPAKGRGLWELFLDATLIDKLILATLAFFSLMSWGIILSKTFQFRRADRQTKRFLEVFRTSKRFSEVNSAAANHSASPLVGLFQSGYVEIDAQVKAAQGEGSDPSRYRIRSMNAIERTLRRALGVELHVLTRSTQFLATTAAACPFIGLFGTVWGIMKAFNDIGITGSTSITAVAPGIAGALINTAAGLVAAIPALVAYNTFSTRVKRSREEMEDFVMEFMNLTERNFT